MRFHPRPGGFIFGFCRARRVLTGEPFNPTWYGGDCQLNRTERPIAARSVSEREEKLCLWLELPFRIAPTFMATRPRGLHRSAHPDEERRPIAARRALRWRAQFALKPASKALGLHGVFIRAKGFKYLIADSAFKRMQVDALGACWLDAHEHHLGLALRTGRALNCSEWNDGREALRLGHDASLEQAGAQHSRSPVMPRRRSGDCVSMRLRDLKRELIRRYLEGSAPRKLRNRKLPPDAASVRRQLPVWGLWQRRGEMRRESLSMIEGISAVTLSNHLMPRASDSTARGGLRSCMAAKIRHSPAFEQERAISTSSPSLPSGAGPGGGGNFLRCRC